MRYGRHGGVSHGEEVALAMRRLHPQPLSMLARWIVGRELICFEWRGATLLPDFQFDASTWLPRPCVRRVVREPTFQHTRTEGARSGDRAGPTPREANIGGRSSRCQRPRWVDSVTCRRAAAAIRSELLHERA
jgi:hypothetical protein